MDIITVVGQVLTSSDGRVSIQVESLDDVYDGYHTINELYDHRCALFVLLAITVKDTYQVCYKIDQQSPGWFILYIESPFGQISYHIPNKMLPNVIESGVVLDQNHEWDGHTSKVALQRLTDWLSRGK